MTLFALLEEYYMNHQAVDATHELSDFAHIRPLLHFDEAEESAKQVLLDLIKKQVLSIEFIKALSNVQTKLNPSSTFSKPIKLDWFGQRQLDLFVDDVVKTFQGIRSRKQVYLLFDVAETDFKIELPSKYLLSFLCLFYELHESGAIKVIGNRGLFVYLHQHLKAPAQDQYPKRNFRKLRYDAVQNLKLKNQISRLIKPLLDKYS